MDSKELSQKLGRIKRLEEVLLKDPTKVKEKLVSVMTYNHLVDSLPDVFSYQDLRMLYDHLIEEKKVGDDLIPKKERIERKKQFLKELKDICSPSAYQRLEYKLNDL